LKKIFLNYENGNECSELKMSFRLKKILMLCICYSVFFQLVKIHREKNWQRIFLESQVPSWELVTPGPDRYPRKENPIGFPFEVPVGSGVLYIKRMLPENVSQRMLPENVLQRMLTKECLPNNVYQ
jgi:hypothetical protein